MKVGVELVDFQMVKQIKVVQLEEKVGKVVPLKILKLQHKQ